MNISPRHFEQFHKIRRYTLIIALAWTGVITASAAWALYSNHLSSLAAARIEAQATFNKDLLYRRWSAMHGGIYVPITEDTQPNPYLDVPNRDVTTTDGLELTLINPAYMTRQVHELSQELYGVKGHITSLNPIRPANAPDEWETQALRDFEAGITPVSSIETINSEPTLRYMQAMYIEESCLTCHADQGYEVGDIRGGISVAVPMQPYWDAKQPIDRAVILGHFVLWMLGMVGIGAAHKQISKDAQQQLTAQQHLQDNEQRLKMTLQGTRAGTWEWNVQTGETVFNERWAEIIGYTLAELKPINIQTWINATHPDDLAQSEMLLKKHFAGELDYYEYEARMKHKEGHWVWVLDRGVVSEWTDEGQPLRMFGTHVDITHRKQMENAIHKSEERYRTVIQSMSEGVILLGQNGVIQTCNPAAERILGLSADQMTGRKTMDPRWQALHEDETPFPGKKFPAVTTLQTGEPRSNVIMGVQRPDHDRAWIMINSRPIYYHDNNGASPDAVITTFTDITELKRVQKQQFELALERERRHLLINFIENATHEFRTPLATISSGAYLMSRTTDATRRSQKAQQIEAQVKRMTKLVDMLLLMSKLESQQPPAKTPLDVSALIKDIWYELDKVCPKQNQLKLDIPPDLPPILGDTDYLADAFKQIIENGCRFTPGDATVTITAGTANDHIWIDIRDTGIGIPEHIRPHIFETFWRGDAAHTTPGFGLGLPIAQKVIEWHGGDIFVKSQEGQGCCFRVVLPL